MFDEFGTIPGDVEGEILHLSTLPGWCPLTKMRLTAAVVHTVALHREPIVAEVGVYGGRWSLTAAATLKYCEEAGVRPRGAVYAIDPWDNASSIEGDISDSERWFETHDFRPVHSAFVRAASDKGLWPWLRVLHASAHLVRDAVPALDVLHIDGNHSSQVSCRDVRDYLPKVRPMGWVFLDDVDWASLAPATRLVEAECSVVYSDPRWRLYQKN